MIIKSMMRPVMKYTLNRRQTMNLNVFHGDVNHKNDVSGRLYSTNWNIDSTQYGLRCRMHCCLFGN